jgi:phosphopantothenoylcysteine decarboxylase/phosphopantothenate--cysteine ligase
LLIKRGLYLLGTGEGALACADVGVGRMEEPEEIVNHILPLLSPVDKKSSRWLVTAGATKEFLDPIRYLTNASSGLTGLLIAEYAALRGNSVTLVATSLPRKARFGVTVIPVVSAADMAKSVKDNADNIAVFVMSAAVADYSILPQTTKIKKGEGGLSLELSRTEDVLLHSQSYMKSNVVRVGFAAETEDLEHNAMKKLQKKSLDLICANKIDDKHNPFGSSENSLVLIDKKGSRVLPMQSKELIAQEVVQHISALVVQKQMNGEGDG